jgi:hypothetical protein
LWSNLGQMQTSKRKRLAAEEPSDGDDLMESTTEPFLFDLIDDSLGVNLGFALKTAKFIAATYGVEHIAPFNLPDAMVELNTVNLVKLPKHVKATHDIKLPFSHMIAWLMGMMSRTNDFSIYVHLSELIKHLTVRGVFLRTSIDPTRIYSDNRLIGKMPPLATVPDFT